MDFRELLLIEGTQAISRGGNRFQMTCRLLPLVAFFGLRASLAQEVRQEPDALQVAL
jgi:hypothetical protein